VGSHANLTGFNVRRLNSAAYNRPCFMRRTFFLVAYCLGTNLVLGTAGSFISFQAVIHHHQVARAVFIGTKTDAETAVLSRSACLQVSEREFQIVGTLTQKAFKTQSLQATDRQTYTKQCLITLMTFPMRWT